MTEGRQRICNIFYLKYLVFIRLIDVDRDTIYKIERPLAKPKKKKKINGILFVPNCTFLKKKIYILKFHLRHDELSNFQ